MSDEPIVMTQMRFVELGADVAGSIMNQMRDQAEEATGKPHVWRPLAQRDALVLEPA